ncbi:MAG: ferrous iron transport protein A [Clostridia bacterium]|nr:ferrous iron transport protein A [Clostridia bacterium]
MLPLTLASIGKSSLIVKVGGSAEVRSHLADLGFVVGTPITVLNTINGNVIVSVMDSRVAISREMAQKIYV